MGMNCSDMGGPYAYYNDVDPTCCEWIGELMKAGLVMDGEVDCRSITDVEAADVEGFTRVHFFAGVGGWDHALRLAGFPADRPVWLSLIHISEPTRPY